MRCLEGDREELVLSHNHMEVSRGDVLSQQSPFGMQWPQLHDQRRAKREQ